MARPAKRGLDYFPFDTDFFRNKKIRRVKSEYGADGIVIYMYLLCEIYKNGYYVIADNDFICSASDDLKMSVNKINQVIRFLLGRSLFDDKLFQSDTVLTSVSVQRRYLFAVEERIKENSDLIKDFWLLKKSDTETLRQVHPFLENSQEKSVKERKEKEKKVNNNIIKERRQNLSEEERESLINEYGEETVNEYIKRTTNYKCCSYKMIKKWIEEDKEKEAAKSKKNSFNTCCEHKYGVDDLKELEQALLHKSFL